MDSEKQIILTYAADELPGSLVPKRQRAPPFYRRPLIVFLFAVFAVSHLSGHYIAHRQHPKHGKETTGEICVQHPALAPGANEALDGNKAVIFSKEYRDKSAGIHSGLIQVRSESFDDLGEVGEDKRYEVFYDVENYLAEAFPLAHANLNKTMVNTHGIVLTWAGSDPSLKPVILMAHQDTVPVPASTLEYWTYPPWSGHYDGKYIWGRGASDCKNTLSGTLEAVTLLLEKGFVPRRTFVLAYGFDEESKGYEGAGHIAEHLEGVYGKDGAAFIIDEGGLGIGEMYGTGFALPSTGEKGYLDVNFTLHTPGGHSSIPPPHTAIGILSSLATRLEASPWAPSLSLDSPIFSLLQCAATHGELPKTLKGDVLLGSRGGKKGDKARKKAADEFAKMGRGQRYLVATSQAADVVGGGVKVNALPETAFLVVNHRIAVDSSVQAVKDHIGKIATELAEAHGLNVDLFGKKLAFESLDPDVPGGDLIVKGVNPLEPAPVSPINAAEWATLASTIKHAYRDQFPDGLVVSPSIMTGNTDTRFYWNLTKHIYRFTPIDRAASFGIHTVDEHLLFDDHITGVYFFHELIRNADATDFE